MDKIPITFNVTYIARTRIIATIILKFGVFSIKPFMSNYLNK